MVYSTQDSRLSAFLVVRGCTLTGTETRYQGDDDRVYLLFEVDENKIANLKREFFEGALVNALEFGNAMKSCMFTIREARELSRQSR